MQEPRPISAMAPDRLFAAPKVVFKVAFYPMSAVYIRAAIRKTFSLKSFAGIHHSKLATLATTRRSRWLPPGAE